MTDLRPADEASNGDVTGLSRRTIVRTAGHAAWATPLVVAATAAPAMAASGTNLDVVTMTAGRSLGFGVAQLSVKNNALVSNAGPRTVRITGTPNAGGNSTSNGLSPLNPNTNWTAAAANDTGAAFTIDVQHSGALAAGATTPSVRIYWSGTGAGNVSAIVITPSTGNNDGAAATYPA